MSREFGKSEMTTGGGPRDRKRARLALQSQIAILLTNGTVYLDGGIDSGSGRPVCVDQPGREPPSQFRHASASDDGSRTRHSDEPRCEREQPVREQPLRGQPVGRPGRIGRDRGKRGRRDYVGRGGSPHDPLGQNGPVGPVLWITGP
jgi:hypothetical protein